MEAEVVQEESDLTKDSSEDKCPLVSLGELLKDVDSQGRALNGRDQQDWNVSKEVVVNDFCSPCRGHFENDGIPRIA